MKENFIENFAVNDDYYFFTQDHVSLNGHPQFVFSILTGRSIYTLFSFFISKYVFLISDLKYFRFIGFVLVYIFSCYYYIKISELFDDVIIPLCLTLIVSLLPGFIVGIYWVTMLPFFVSLLCSILAAELVINSTSRFTIVAAVLLQLVSLFIYQSWAMFYLLPILLFCNGKNDRTIICLKVFHCLVVFLFATVMYLFIQKVIILNYVFSLGAVWKESYSHFGNYKFILNYEVFNKFKDILFRNDSMFANFWDIYKCGWGKFLLIYYGLSLLFNFFMIRNFKSILIFILILISFSPILFTKGHLGFRVMLPSQVLIITHLIFLNSNVINKYIYHKLLIFTFTTVLCAYSYKNINDSISNELFEYNYLSGVIYNYALHKKTIPNSISVILHDVNIGFNSKKMLGNGEFNVNSTSNWQNIPWIIKSIIRENNFDKFKYNFSGEIYNSFINGSDECNLPLFNSSPITKQPIIINEYYANENINCDKNELIINMSNLYFSNW